MGGADAGSAPQHNKVCQRVSHTATAVQFTIEVRNRTHADILTRYHNWYRYSTDACVDQWAGTDVPVQSIIGLWGYYGPLHT